MISRIRMPSHAVLLLGLMLLPRVAFAQWRTQTLSLQPGWNAVHLDVSPEPADCDIVFAQVAVESVWKWNRRFSSIQFLENPLTPVPEDPDWLVWLPPANGRFFLRRLVSLQANQSYLIKVADNSAPVTLPIKGLVVPPRFDWFQHGLNLVGFPVNPVNPPTFGKFFEFTEQIDTSRGFGNELYRLNRQGQGERIVQPYRDRLQPGAAYWIAVSRQPSSMSSIQVIAPGGSIDFGARLHTQDLQVRNTHPSDAIAVWLRLLESESPPLGSTTPELAGPVPLSYLSRNDDGSADWIELPDEGLTKTLAPGEGWTLRLGVRRGDLPFYQPQTSRGASYQSVLELADSAQSLLLRVPVTASAPEFSTVLRATGTSNGSTNGLSDFNEKAGLWVGTVSLDQVNSPAYTTNTVIPTPAPLALRLILHLDNTGQARLLQEVLLAWDPTLTDAPHTNGTYALYANEEALPASASQVRRISSVGFPLMSPVPLSAGLTNSLGATNSLAGTVRIGFADPTNPFLHRYHPLHDNKDWDFVAYTNAVEVPNIDRFVELTFTDVASEAVDPLWGTDALAGTYGETITGLRAQPIYLQGGFALQRLSRIDQLQGIEP